MKLNPTDGLAYVWIPPGEFQMGCSEGDGKCHSRETPRHRVRISRGFWIGKTQVTVAAYRKFSEATRRGMPKEPVFRGRALNPGWAEPQQPIVNVTWDEATEYCEWAGGRLPSEAEWEYAARAGSQFSSYGDLAGIAWFADNAGRVGLDSTRVWNEQVQEDFDTYCEILEQAGHGPHSVGGKQANAWGLNDVLGNVWEWVNDWYDESYYAASPKRDPRGPSAGEGRVVRGGAWTSYTCILRLSHRVKFAPDHCYEALGFRCIRDQAVQDCEPD